MTSPTQRVWASLGTSSAVRVISIGMLIYLLVIGMLTFGYIKVQSCVTDYANDSATSTKARSDAAADDRRLNDAEGRLADSDRDRYRANQKALSELLAIISDPGADKAAKAAKFGNLIRVDRKSSTVLDQNEAQRTRIRQERKLIEAQRAKNPPPPPPSETC